MDIAFFVDKLETHTCTSLAQVPNTHRFEPVTAFCWSPWSKSISLTKNPPLTSCPSLGCKSWLEKMVNMPPPKPSVAFWIAGFPLSDAKSLQQKDSPKWHQTPKNVQQQKSAGEVSLAQVAHLQPLTKRIIAYNRHSLVTSWMFDGFSSLARAGLCMHGGKAPSQSIPIQYTPWSCEAKVSLFLEIFYSHSWLLKNKKLVYTKTVGHFPSTLATWTNDICLSDADQLFSLTTYSLVEAYITAVQNLC